MAKHVAKGDEAIAKAKAKTELRRVELWVWYEGTKLRRRVVPIS